MQKQNKKLPENFSIEDISFADYTILSCALSYDLFEDISQGINTEENLKKRIPTKILIPLLLSLVSFGYLNKKNNNRYDLTEISKTYLLNRSPKNITPLMKNSEWYWLLVEGPKMKKNSISLKDSTLEAIIDISDKISNPVIDELRKQFPEIFNEKLDILDIGCGKMGVFTKIGPINTKLKLTGIEENPYAVNYLKKIKKEALGNRLKIIKEDIFKVKNLNRKYDVVYLSHIIHCIPTEKIVNLLKFCKGHLRKNGTILIYEDYLSDDGLLPKPSVRKNLILAFLGYKIPTKSELEKLLLDLGFSDISSKIINSRRILVSALNKSS